MRIDRAIVFGKRARYTYWGLRGCYHGNVMGGYDYYVYGIKGVFNIIIDKRWGDMANIPPRF